MALLSLKTHPWTDYTDTAAIQPSTVHGSIPDAIGHTAGCATSVNENTCENDKSHHSLTKTKKKAEIESSIQSEQKSERQQ